MSATLNGSMIRREIGDDKICTLIFDRPESGANIFDAATMQDLDGHLDAIASDRSLRGVIVISAKKSIFIAGADLKTLLKQAQTGEMRAFIAEGQRVFNRLASLPIPTCAAIHGACAGGGYEITLACDYRVASDEPATRIGLPETTLGLIPAWGGATRLPRLVGPKQASEIILKGKLYSAREAADLGMVDEVTTRENLLEAARARLAMGKRETKRARDPEGAQISAPRGRSNGAPARALGVITTGLTNSVDDSLAMELDAIVDLAGTEATQNLIRNFFLAEKYKKGSSKTAIEKVAHAAVIGAGVMGSGIAQWLSSRGVAVILRDVSSEQIDRGLSNIDKTYGDAVKRGLMSEEKAREGRARIVASTAPVELRDVQVVIEAASEKLEVKTQIFHDLAPKVGPQALLATNTSALPIGKLADQTNAPERVLGLHFFNPVSRMKLVEVVVGEKTSDESRERGLAFVRQVGKLPVVVRDSPGFLVNRVLFPYLLDAAALFEQGVDAVAIDSALTTWGMPMGPLRLIDEIGVDITVDIANTLEKAYGARDAAPKILREMLSAKMLGRKSGAGIYEYQGKDQKPNGKVKEWRQPLIPAEATGLANRLVFLMVNEAARCLEEGVVESPEDADYGMILGTGFPTVRGGPLRFAEHYGIDRVVRDMEKLAQQDGKFAPAEILRRHAQNGTTFYRK